MVTLRTQSRCPKDHSGFARSLDTPNLMAMNTTVPSDVPSLPSLPWAAASNSSNHSRRHPSLVQDHFRIGLRAHPLHHQLNRMQQLAVTSAHGKKSTVDANRNLAQFPTQPAQPLSRLRLKQEWNGERKPEQHNTLDFFAQRNGDSCQRCQKQPRPSPWVVQPDLGSDLYVDGE